MQTLNFVLGLHITVENSLNASRVYIRLCKHGKRFLLLKYYYYCLFVDMTNRKKKRRQNHLLYSFMRCEVNIFVCSMHVQLQNKIEVTGQGTGILERIIVTSSDKNLIVSLSSKLLECFFFSSYNRK